MATLIFALALFLMIAPMPAQSIKPVYQLPSGSVSSEKNTGQMLVGSDHGLFKVTASNNLIPLWTEGRVDQILRVESRYMADADGWFLRTTKGIFFTSDLKNFEERNDGLPFLTVKKYDGKEARTEKQIHNIEDMSVNPINQNEMVVATKKSVYISRDGGKLWKDLKSMSMITPGIKAVAVATIDFDTVVFMSHPLLGMSYIFPDAENSEWHDVDKGFESMPSLSTPDEISDIVIRSHRGPDGRVASEAYFSQTFLPRIYKFNWNAKEAELIYCGNEIMDVTDGLTLVNDVLMFTTVEGFSSVDLKTLESPGKPSAEDDWHKAFSVVSGTVNTAWIPQNRSGFDCPLTLNELWLLYPGSINTPYAEKADGKKSVYASAYQCRNQDGIDKFKKIVKDNNLNSIVIDMKDDAGILRYESKDPEILKKAKTSMYAITLDDFVRQFKADGIYLIARVVVFKDKNLAGYDNSKYAVWDGKTNKPWIGIKGYENEETLYYDESWVDPYCHEVWEYNVQIANELVSRGFDEIQFDYIRFPTDGYNLKNAKYRWKDAGMDKESALVSFLSYARENIDAPLGIDIYGANGWYRSGTRTGQDAETLCEYVDVIGPMFYPSHFENSFLNYAPVADRTYRIYYYGTFRNSVICRNRAIIRPWVQAFYLNVPYDRLYYDADYIQKQVFGVRDSVDRGYMYWNNSGDYSRLLPDVTNDQPFTGTAPEASGEYRKPALGKKKKQIYSDPEFSLSVLDCVLYQDELREIEAGEKKSYIPFLQIPIFGK